MKKALALTALSAALFASFPAVGADAPAAEPVAAAPAKPAVKPFSSPMIDALTALGTELKAAMGTGKGNPIPHLDKLAAHQYSPATVEKLRKVFGTAEPLQIKRSDAVPGMVGYTISAPAHSYTDPENGSTVAWEDLKLDMTLDKQGRDLTSIGSWPSVSISSKDVTVTASGMTMQSKQHRTAQDLWLGKMQAGIDTIAAGPGGKGVLFEGFSVTAAATQRGTGVDFAYDTRIKSIKADTVQIDDVQCQPR